MSVTLGKNIAALKAQRQVADTSEKLEQTFARLSSGQRINNISDDAAGMAIAESLKTSSRVFTQGIRNLNDGISVINIASNALDSLSNITIRQKELAEQAAQGIYTHSQRQALENENKALYNEYNRIVESTKFNGRSLLDASQNDLRVQAGFGTDGGIGFTLNSDLNRNVGTGNFGTGQNISSLAPSLVADIDNDGDQDLIIISSNIEILKNDGSAAFTSSTSAALTNPIDATATFGDVNGDGFVDLIIPIFGDISISLNQGNGTFSTNNTALPNLNIASGSVGSLKTGDFNGDGNLDITWCDATTNSINLTFGNGTGGFSAPTSSSSAYFSSSIVGDINGDGFDDIIAFDNATNSGGLYVYLGNAGGSLNGSHFASFYNPLLLSDFNDDGFMDILSSGGGSSSIYFGNSTGTFNTSATTSISEESFAVGDFNGDGESDILVNFISSTPIFGIRLGHGDGTFSSSVTAVDFTYGSSYDPYTFFVNDFNGDDVSDILFSASSGSVVNDLAIQDSTTSNSAKKYKLDTRQNALEAVTGFTKQLNKITAQKGTLGAAQSRLEVAANTNASAIENYTIARSQIVDVDVASESANLVRLQILQNAGVAILAQANQTPSITLTLLRENSDT